MVNIGGAREESGVVSPPYQAGGQTVTYTNVFLHKFAALYPSMAHK